LPNAVYRDLRAHCEEAWPHECCGALLGHSVPDGWQVDSLLRAVNIRADSPRNRYEIAPAELAGIVLEARNRGLEIAGFYHSHPGHPAQPSSTDLAEAYWLGCSYVITEVAQGKAALTDAFLLTGTTEENKRFEPQTIQIEDRPANP
jgi:proteasome lid subunit RPN8/RPN11